MRNFIVEESEETAMAPLKGTGQLLTMTQCMGIGDGERLWEHDIVVLDMALSMVYQADLDPIGVGPGKQT